MTEPPTFLADSSQYRTFLDHHVLVVPPVQCHNCLGVDPSSCLVCNGSGFVPAPVPEGVKPTRCPECRGEGRKLIPIASATGTHRGNIACGHCRATGLVLAEVRVAVEVRRHQRGGHWFEWHIPSEEDGDEGCESASESYTTERGYRTHKGRVEAVLPVVESGTTHEHAALFGFVEMDGRQRWFYSTGASDELVDVYDVTDEPWASDLVPGCTVYRFTDVEELAEPEVVEGLAAGWTEEER